MSLPGSRGGESKTGRCSRSDPRSCPNRLLHDRVLSFRTRLDPARPRRVPLRGCASPTPTSSPPRAPRSGHPVPEPPLVVRSTPTPSHHDLTPVHRRVRKTGSTSPPTGGVGASRGRNRTGGTGGNRGVDVPPVTRGTHPSSSFPNGRLWSPELRLYFARRRALFPICTDTGRHTCTLRVHLQCQQTPVLVRTLVLSPGTLLRPNLVCPGVVS